MQAAHLRLTITLVIALIGHLVLLYPTPKLIPTPLIENTYSVEIELTSEKSSENAQAAEKIKDKDQIESKASTASEAKSHQEKTLKQAFSETQAHNNKPQPQTPIEKTATKASEAGIPTPVIKPLKETQVKQTKAPVLETVKVEKSEKKESTEKAELIEKPTPEPIQDTIQTNESEAIKQIKSLQSEASSKNTVKSDNTPKPELSATELYEAQIYAWILTGPSSRIFEGYGDLKQPVTIRATWWKNGTVIFATIKQSSGNPTADEAAKRTVLSASPYPRIPDHLNKKEYSLDITLKYFDK
jgi:TonB family protein